MDKSYNRKRVRSAVPTTGFMNTIGIRRVSDSTSGPYTTSKSDEVFHDVVTPNYKKKVRNGAIVNTSCHYNKVEMESLGSAEIHYNMGSYEWRHEGAVTENHQQTVGGGTYVLTDNTPLGDTADLSRFYALKQLDPTPYSFGEDLFELGETLRFLKNPLGSLARLSKSYKRSYDRGYDRLKRKKKFNRNAVLDPAQAHADAWLQYRFAASPLVRSIQDGLEAYEKKEKRPPTRRTARGFANSSNSGNRLHETDKDGSTFVYDQNASYSAVCRSSILYQVSNPVYDKRWRLGLRTKDIPETLWAVMPWSFMIDRVVDVSGFIRANTNLSDPRVKILAGSTVAKMDNIRSYQLVDVKRPQSGLVTTGTGETVVHKEFDYIRDTWSPSFGDTIPSVTPKGLVSDLTKIADLTSLILTNFRR